MLESVVGLVPLGAWPPFQHISELSSGMPQSLLGDLLGLLISAAWQSMMHKPVMCRQPV